MISNQYVMQDKTETLQQQKQHWTQGCVILKKDLILTSFLVIPKASANFW
jgi:hypothetical protein